MDVPQQLGHTLLPVHTAAASTDDKSNQLQISSATKNELCIFDHLIGVAGEHAVRAGGLRAMIVAGHVACSAAVASQSNTSMVLGYHKKCRFSGKTKERRVSALRTRAN